MSPSGGRQFGSEDELSCRAERVLSFIQVGVFYELDGELFLCVISSRRDWQAARQA